MKEDKVLMEKTVKFYLSELEEAIHTVEGSIDALQDEIDHGVASSDTEYIDRLEGDIATLNRLQDFLLKLKAPNITNVAL